MKILTSLSCALLLSGCVLFKPAEDNSPIEYEVFTSFTADDSSGPGGISQEHWFLFDLSSRPHWSYSRVLLIAEVIEPGGFEMIKGSFTRTSTCNWTGISSSYMVDDFEYLNTSSGVKVILSDSDGDSRDASIRGYDGAIYDEWLVFENEISYGLKVRMTSGGSCPGERHFIKAQGFKVKVRISKL